MECLCMYVNELKIEIKFAHRFAHIYTINFNEVNAFAFRVILGQHLWQVCVNVTFSKVHFNICRWIHVRVMFVYAPNPNHLWFEFDFNRFWDSPHYLNSIALNCEKIFFNELYHNFSTLIRYSDSVISSTIILICLLSNRMRPVCTKHNIIINNLTCKFVISVKWNWKSGNLVTDFSQESIWSWFHTLLIETARHNKIPHTYICQGIMAFILHR